ncbi:hypothetical protein [Longitalea arenae]|uniref:hypothetical protein n=1 Tax=Longitalea arenae TaxID=2812558 RepID=UPI001966FBC3|nr:hypothetical protein [Longitalea arenae]
MKKILIVITLLCIEKALYAQYIYTIKADSVKITNTCDTAELIIENHTQNVPGFLFNKGRGRTEFRRVSQFDDTSVVIGGDTIHLGRGNKNFANADLTFTGNRIHNGLSHSMKLTNFGELYFKSKTSDDFYSSEMKMDSLEGYSLIVKNASNPDVVYSTSQTMNMEYIDLDTRKTSGNFGSASGLSFNTQQLSLTTGDFDMSTGEGSTVGISMGLLTDYDPKQIDIFAEKGPIHIYTNNSETNKSIFLNLNKSDSLVIGCGAPGTISRYSQNSEGFFFRNNDNKNTNFFIMRLPASTSSSDSILVVDNNGQIKKRSQSPTRKSITVTGASYTIPADIDVVFVNYGAGQATISLPTGTLDREITIKNLHTANTVILSGLDTNESNSISTRGAITVKYTGTSWVGISKY